MPDERFEFHLASPQGAGHRPPGAAEGQAGGDACGDMVRMAVAVDAAGIVDAGFEAQGCGATRAAASAAVELVRGRSLLDAARVGTHDVAGALGGLSPGKIHAAELACDALHAALGRAARGASLAAEPRRVLVAMSGGVDSAVAALLLAREADVAAVTLELWRDRDNDAQRSCCSATAVRAARSLAHRLGLPHLTLDLREEFRAGVVDPFLADHAAGLTPNPCVRCNGSVRLDAMLELAERIGARALATGHYARVRHEPAGPLLALAADPAKDQTYMLAGLAPSSLQRMRFPLGDLTKPQVRAIAAEAELPVASKADSQDLCFLAGTSRTAFLARHGAIADRPGDVVDERGRVLGRHRGQHAFTVGQRRGLGVAASQPLYVLGKDAATNRVTVGPRRALRRFDVAVRDATLHRSGSEVDRVKLRYRSRALPCRLTAPARAPAGVHPRVRLELDEPADAVAPGQIACLMRGEAIVGWGTIAPGGAPERRTLAK